MARSLEGATVATGGVDAEPFGERFGGCGFLPVLPGAVSGRVLKKAPRVPPSSAGSPSTRTYDRKTKLAAYRDAGVPELWLVDPQTLSVVIYGWKDGQFIELERGGEGDEVGSTVLPGFRVQVGQLFR